MSDYTIKSGDCLWTIARNTYNLTSNSDIQKAVNEIVTKNNIKNPNLIYANNVLSLPEYDSLFGTSKQVEQEPSKTQKYDEYLEWQKNSTQSFTDNPQGIDEIEDFAVISEYNPDTYLDEMRSFADQNITSVDADGSGTINFDEFLEQETSAYQEIYGEDMDLDTPVSAGAVMTQSSIDSFNGADTSKDGMIQFSEYLKGEVDNFNSYFENEADQMVYDEETQTVTSNGIDVTEFYRSEFSAISGDKDYIAQSDYMANDVSLLNQSAGYEKYRYDEATNSIIDTEEEVLPYNNQREFMEMTFKAMDMNGDNEIDRNELATFYTVLDSVDSKEGQVDGKIKFSSTMRDIVSTPGFKNLYDNVYHGFYEEKQEQTSEI
ncbi:MAG: LysM peptidoglycan-binding domain-containing protein [Candidatus Gastranaerophilales bacterium]|nr:LysM peptidoglycan-binding domain-containing protein [Candidatus Gastranaerophilales bacterium]